MVPAATNEIRAEELGFAFGSSLRSAMPYTGKRAKTSSKEQVVDCVLSVPVPEMVSPKKFH